MLCSFVVVVVVQTGPIWSVGALSSWFLCPIEIFSLKYFLTSGPYKMSLNPCFVFFFFHSQPWIQSFLQKACLVNSGHEMCPFPQWLSAALSQLPTRCAAMLCPKTPQARTPSPTQCLSVQALARRTTGWEQGDQEPFCGMTGGRGVCDMSLQAPPPLYAALSYETT